MFLETTENSSQAVGSWGRSGASTPLPEGGRVDMCRVRSFFPSPPRCDATRSVRNLRRNRVSHDGRIPPAPGATSRREAALGQPPEQQRKFRLAPGPRAWLQSRASATHQFAFPCLFAPGERLRHALARSFPSPTQRSPPLACLSQCLGHLPRSRPEQPPPGELLRRGERSVRHRNRRGVVAGVRRGRRACGYHRRECGEHGLPMDAAGAHGDRRLHAARRRRGDPCVRDGRGPLPPKRHVA